jgi:hypothetical protein
MTQTSIEVLSYNIGQAAKESFITEYPNKLTNIYSKAKLSI